MNFAQWIKGLFVTLDAPQVLRTQLADARVQRAEQAALREYHAAMERMLVDRITRIDRELKGRGYADK